MTTSKVTLSESTTGLTPKSEGLYDVRLIASDIQGSSGYYSRGVLESHGKAAFPMGTKVYLDHPTRDEAENRPERSVKDIAGYIASEPEMREDGLYGAVKFGESYVQLMKDFAPILGMSIRAQGEIEESEDESGTIRRNVTALYPSPLNSVDVVTAPGAGGKIVGALHESFREISETKETERTVPMDEKDIQRIVEALKPLFVTLAESLKPEAPQKEEETAPDLAAVTESAVEAGLTKAARARVVASVKAGTDIAEAIQAEKDYTAEVLAEAKIETNDTANGVVHKGNADVAARFNALFPGGN